MPHFTKPAEGSWTQHYPELGTGPVSHEDSISPEHYELERDASFRKTWLNVGRVEDPEVVRRLFHDGLTEPDRRDSPRSRRGTRPRGRRPCQEAPHAEGDQDHGCWVAAGQPGEGVGLGLRLDAEHGAALSELLSVLQRPLVVLRVRRGADRLRETVDRDDGEPPRSSASRSSTQYRRRFLLSAPFTRTS